ncbi:MAG: hypothetical protein LBR07_07760 [Puniceicoccales bacterium]|jgi:opacity protein-like surface antigen|nr:hypothetical protein [Puniceicoccales bacterium]
MPPAQKLALPALLATLAAAAPLNAAGAAETTGAAGDFAPSPAPTPRTSPGFYAGVAVGGQLVDWQHDSKSPFLYGATFTGGAAFFRNSPNPFLKNLLFTADVGAYFGDWKVGAGGSPETVTGTNTTYGSYTPDPNATGFIGDYTGWQTRYNATTSEFSSVRRKSEQTSVPLMLSAIYNFEFGDRKQFNVRVGPSLGLTYVSMKTTLTETLATTTSVTGDILDDQGEVVTLDDPQLRHSNTVQGTPVRTSGSDSDILFTYGLTLGAWWRVTRQIDVGLQYRFLGTTGFDSKKAGNYGTSTAHQINLGASWRF